MNSASTPQGNTTMAFSSITRRALFKRSAALAALAAGAGLIAGNRPAFAEALPPDDLTHFDLEGKTVTLLANAAHGKSWSHISDLFKKQTGGILKVTAVPYTQLAQKQLLDVESGANQYDLFQYQTQLLGTLVSSGALLDITQWVGANENALNIQDLAQSGYRAGGFYKGRLYGLTNVGVPNLLFYNNEILGQFNLKPPTTWEEFRAVAEEVTAKGQGKIWGSALQAQKDATTLLMTYGGRLSGFGGSYFDAGGKPIINSPEAVAALTELKKELPSAMPDPLLTGWQQATSSFLQGKLALADSWGDITALGNDPTQSDIVGKYGAAALPPGGGNTHPVFPVFVNSEALGISSASQNAKTAAAWLQWISRTDVNVQIATTPGGNWPSLYKSVLTSDRYRKINPFADIIVKQFDGNALYWPSGVNAIEVAQALADQVSDVLAGGQQPQAALDRAQQSWLSNLQSA
jgi:multiple sugar transport system substrate-binding protein